MRRYNTGEPIMLDDFREAYWWLRDSTPEDARIMVRSEQRNNTLLVLLGHLTTCY